MNRTNSVRINLQIAPRYAGQVRPRVPRRAARAALEQQQMRGRLELTIVITGDAQLRALNREFRQIDAPTDVLSFAIGDEALPGSQPRYLGGVVISFMTARAQARAGGHPIEAELQLLVVHGVLHLLGHDHDTRVEKAKMWRAQAEILRRLGSAITGPNE
jgi:probable rRNA maturation factor